MNRLDTTTRCRVVSCLVEGMSIRATVRVTRVSKNTIQKLLLELGAACSAYQDRTLVNLKSERIQIDECWAFVYCKSKNVTPEIAEGRIAGDVWTWAAIDADSKLIPCWTLGRRDADTASSFVADLAARLSDRIQLTSDGLKAYIGAVAAAFHGQVDYAQLVKVYNNTTEGEKRYSPAVCVGCERTRIFGGPDPRYVSTSFIERANLTMRMGMRRFTRLTNGFSKKIENHAAAVSLHMMHYNFARKHQTLGTSPAVKAGVADHIWSIEEIVGLLENSN